MITVAQIVAAFRNIIGWPYKSPGSNNKNGIDCSGAFVYAYKLYGQSIYHGSNRIIRVYCKEAQAITSVGQLRPGMAVFKYRTDLSQMSDIYKPGGQYYDPDLPYDYYHMGLVSSVEPLQIIHATTPVAKVDTTLSGGWRVAANLSAVDYQAAPPTPEPSYAVTIAPSGSTVNLRRSPTKQSVVLVRVPLGQTVRVNEAYDDVWWNVTYQRTTGYMMREFLQGVALAQPVDASPFVEASGSDTENA